MTTFPCDYDYDPGFEEFLTTEIFWAVVEACRCTGTDVAALRSPEMMTALVTILSMTLTLSRHAQSPATLCTEIGKLTDRLHRQTRETLGSADFQTLPRTIFRVDDVEGHA